MYSRIRAILEVHIAPPKFFKNEDTKSNVKRFKDGSTIESRYIRVTESNIELGEGAESLH